MRGYKFGNNHRVHFWGELLEDTYAEYGGRMMRGGAGPWCRSWQGLFSVVLASGKALFWWPYVIMGMYPSYVTSVTALAVMVQWQLWRIGIFGNPAIATAEFINSDILWTCCSVATISRDCAAPRETTVLPLLVGPIIFTMAFAEPVGVSWNYTRRLFASFLRFIAQWPSTNP